MLKIKVELKDHKSSSALNKAIKKAAVGAIVDWVRKRVGESRCNTHGNGSSIKVIGTGINDLRFEVSGCCPEFVKTLEKVLRGTMIKFIPTQPADTAEVAQKVFSDALAEPKTTYLLFRSLPETEDATNVVATKADALALRDNPKEWRVMWIKNAALLSSETISLYFGADEKIAVVSLRWGTGEPRQVEKRFLLSELPTRISIGEAFTAAGPREEPA